MKVSLNFNRHKFINNNYERKCVLWHIFDCHLQWKVRKNFITNSHLSFNSSVEDSDGFVCVSGVMRLFWWLIYLVRRIFRLGQRTL